MITVLAEQLEIVEKIKVLQQYEISFGDYTKEREGWLGNPDLKDLFDAVKRSEKMN